jgi:hypothetical protein
MVHLSDLAARRLVVRSFCLNYSSIARSRNLRSSRPFAFNQLPIDRIEIEEGNSLRKASPTLEQITYQGRGRRCEHLERLATAQTFDLTEDEGAIAAPSQFPVLPNWRKIKKQSRNTPSAPALF